MSVNSTTRAFQEPIETEFNTSMAKLMPLKAKIAATDRLIDLIVYTLYGLTSEAIFFSLNIFRNMGVIEIIHWQKQFSILFSR